MSRRPGGPPSHRGCRHPRPLLFPDSGFPSASPPRTPPPAPEPFDPSAPMRLVVTGQGSYDASPAYPMEAIEDDDERSGMLLGKRLLLQRGTSYDDSVLVLLMRTLRSPPGSTVPMEKCPTPEGRFPIAKVSDFRDRVPSEWLRHPDAVFIPVWRREAVSMEIIMSGHRGKAIKIGSGGRNILTDKAWTPKLKRGDRDYFQTPSPRLRFIGGSVASEKNTTTLRQFVRSDDIYDGLSIACWDICPSSYARATVPGLPQVNSRGHLQVYVKSLTGKVTTLDVGASGKQRRISPVEYTVRDLKECMTVKERIPADQLRLIYAGRELTDEYSLADYRIYHESTVHLVMSLRGRSGPLVRRKTRRWEYEFDAPSTSTFNWDVQDPAAKMESFIHFVSPGLFCEITGVKPTCPITRKSYEGSELKWHPSYEEESFSVFGRERVDWLVETKGVPATVKVSVTKGGSSIGCWMSLLLSC